jgi:hypothetical protein
MSDHGMRGNFIFSLLFVEGPRSCWHDRLKGTIATWNVMLLVVLPLVLEQRGSRSTIDGFHRRLLGTSLAGLERWGGGRSDWDVRARLLRLVGIVCEAAFISSALSAPSILSI